MSAIHRAHLSFIPRLRKPWGFLTVLIKSTSDLFDEFKKIYQLLEDAKKIKLAVQVSTDTIQFNSHDACSYTLKKGSDQFTLSIQDDLSKTLLDQQTKIIERKIFKNGLSQKFLNDHVFSQNPTYWENGISKEEFDSLCEKGNK